MTKAPPPKGPPVPECLYAPYVEATIAFDTATQETIILMRNVGDAIWMVQFRTREHPMVVRENVYGMGALVSPSDLVN